MTAAGRAGRPCRQFLPGDPEGLAPPRPECLGPIRKPL